MKIAEASMQFLKALENLHTSQRIGQHGITGTQTVEFVFKYWSRLDQAV